MRKKLILSLLLSPDLWKNLFFVLTSCYYSYSNLSYSRVTVDHLCRKKEFAQRHTLYLLYHAIGNIQTSVTPAWKSINWVTSVNGKLMMKMSIQKKWDVTCYTIKLLCLATVTSQAQFTCKRQDHKTRDMTTSTRHHFPFLSEKQVQIKKHFIKHFHSSDSQGH